MRVQNPVAIVLILSVSALLTACQKKPTAILHAAEKDPSPAAVKSPLNKKDLGVLPLSNHVSTTVSLGKHKECTISPTLLRNGKLQIILAMTTMGPDGRPQSMNVARVLTRPGEPFDVSIGDIDLAFTPQLTGH